MPKPWTRTRPSPFEPPKLAASIALVALTLGTGTLESQESGTTASYEEEVAQWRSERVERLTAEDGWLTLVGLHWLDEGPNTLGTDSSNDIRLPPGSAPNQVGAIVVTGSEVRVNANDGAVAAGGQPIDTLVLSDDAEGEPTVLEIGDLRAYVIARAGRYALRVKDPTSFARRSFRGIEHYDTTQEWQMEARFEAYDPPRKLPVPTVVDDTLQEMMSPGAVVFQVDGKTYRIEAQAESADSPLFLIFGDRTNGRTTYGGGRYLYTDPPNADGSVRVDFNKTYNPPCAYTPFATCPLPPRQNRLDVAIEAGEKFDRTQNKS